MTDGQADVVARLSGLFRGYEHAHGRFEIKRVSERGKSEGQARTVKGAPSPQIWAGHIDGRGAGLGIIPLMSDDNVVWGVIDIDVNSIDHIDLEKKCRALGLPLVVCRSKSGGAHCFLFASEPVPGALVVAKLSSWAAALGYGGSEVFPKQTARYNEDDLGNWLNMPYFNAQRTSRFCVHEGQELEINEFVAFAESMAVTPAQLSEVQIAPAGGSSSLFADGPPCLQIIERNGGFLEGTRNDGMFNVAVYLKRRFPDSFAAKLAEYNAKMCDPALPPADINNTTKSVDKKDYEYRCRLAPINAFCNRRECVKRDYGIGDNLPPLALTKLDGQPVYWLVEYNGKRIMLETRELMMQRLFQEKVGQVINDYPKTLKQADWEARIGEAMRTCTVQEVHEDDTEVGQFKLTVMAYLKGRSKTISKSDLASSSAPYRADHDEVWFRLAGLKRHLDTHGHKYRSDHQLAQSLKAMGAEPETVRIDVGSRSTPTRIWKLAVEADEPAAEDRVPFRKTEF